MIGMKTFVVVNGIVGFTLLSSCSARPIPLWGDERLLRGGAASIEATDEAHPLLSSPVEIPHSNFDPQHGTPNLEQAEADRIEVENSLTALQNNRILPEVHGSGVSTPRREEYATTSGTKSVGKSKAFKATSRGIQKEIEAYQALARGRLKKAKKLADEATQQQQKAFSLIPADRATFLISLQKHREVTNLNKQVQEYKSLPSRCELLAALESFDEDFPPRVAQTTPAANQDISTPLKTQHTPSSTMHSDITNLVEHQGRESLPKNPDTPSVVNTPKRVKVGKVVLWLSRMSDLMDKARLREALSYSATIVKGYELQALMYLRVGDNAGAVKKIQTMQREKQQALQLYKDYKIKGYRTIDEQTLRGRLYTYLQTQAAQQWAIIKSEYKTSSQKVEENKERLLHNKSPKPSNSVGL